RHLHGGCAGLGLLQSRPHRGRTERDRARAPNGNARSRHPRARGRDRRRCAACSLEMKRLLIVVLALLAPAAARAHEIGKTQVTAVFHPGLLRLGSTAGTFQLDIVVDPDALLTKLEVYGERNVSKGLSRVERDRRIQALERVIIERVDVRFDGNRVTPRLQYLPSSALGDLAQAPSIVRLTGRVPAAAQHVRFAYGLAL